MGKLSNWHYVMRTWLQEESVQTRSGVDIISDRLMFAALAVAPLAKMRDGGNLPHLAIGSCASRAQVVKPL